MTNERKGQPLTKSEYDVLLFYARENSKKRIKKEVSEPQEDIRIIWNAVLPDSYIRPHKHENCHTPDILTALKGYFRLFIFDDEGKVTDATLVSRGKVVEIPANTWHSVVALSPCVYSEEEREFEKREVFPNWAPKEETPEGEIYLEELREREAVDKKESQG
ncbi:WbuC family cupin fold metalloprotein [Candidatus Woesebacteria bacterium]|nr:WbuC family cupin fold metalloprotein [Candidatus Woesebacteria bacterium]